VVLLEPVERVLAEERADLPAALAVEVDRVAPGGCVAPAEEGGRVGVQEVPLRAEVVVDDVEEDREPARVTRLDERFQVLGAPVPALGRERQHAVVPPAPAAGEVGERHQLERGDTEVGEVIEPCRGCRQRALRRERADVQLVEDQGLPRVAAPGRVGPLEPPGVHDLAGAVHVPGLEARGRIGHAQGAVDAIVVARATARALDRGLEPAVGRGPERAGRLAGGVEAELDCGRARRPEAEPDPAAGQHVGAEGHRVSGSHGARCDARPVPAPGRPDSPRKGAVGRSVSAVASTARVAVGRHGVAPSTG